MADELTTDSDRPSTFRDVFANGEYRAIYLSLLVNWLGDYLARAAITVLVYQESRSVLLSAAAFAVSYLPWIVGGPLLAALAERYPYRRVMVVCDLARMLLVSILIIPGLPVPVLLALLFVVALGNPPNQAARSALLPLLLDRRHLPIALAVNSTVGQVAQVAGYVAGASLAAAVNPQVAIAVDALTFGVSAALVAFGVRERPPANTRAARQHLMREAAQGFRLVFGSPVLRSIALLVFAVAAFAIVPEGLAAAWAAENRPDAAGRGFDQGMIMAAGPVGFIIGGLVVSRFLRPSVRDRAIRPLAVIAPLALVPALFAPQAPVVAALALVSGIAQGGLTPTLNAKFVLALPHGYRARAFGVILQGLQLSQGAAVLLTGLLADRASVATVVGLWSVGGVLLMVVLVATWPRPAAFEQAIDRAAETMPPTAPPPAPPAVPPAVPPAAPPAVPPAAPPTATASGRGRPRVRAVTPENG